MYTARLALLMPLLATLAAGLVAPPTLAQPAPIREPEPPSEIDLAFDEVRLTVSLGAPTTLTSPPLPSLAPWSANLTATRASWVVEDRSRRVSLGLDPDRFVPGAHLADGDLWLREVSSTGDDYDRPGQLVRVSPSGKKTTLAVAFPGRERSTFDRVCAERYWVAIMETRGTVIYDLAADRIVVHDRAAGIHDRADAYRGPTCSPDGRYVAVPGSHHQDVIIIRLADGTRAARLGPELARLPLRPGVPAPPANVIEPGAVTWLPGPHAKLIVHTTWVAPPK